MTKVQSGGSPAYPPPSDKVNTPFAQLVESAHLTRLTVEQDADIPVAEILDGILAVIGELYLIVADHDANPLFNRIEALSAADPALARTLDDRADMLGMELAAVLGKAAPKLPLPDGTRRAANRARYRLFGWPVRQGSPS
jgi:hypothetical protein